MSMETSLADKTDHPGYRHDLYTYEKFKTRMLQIDLPLRYGFRDPIQHFLRKGFRRLWYTLNVLRLSAGDKECGQNGPLCKAVSRRAPGGDAATWGLRYTGLAGCTRSNRMRRTASQIQG